MTYLKIRASQAGMLLTANTGGVTDKQEQEIGKLQLKLKEKGLTVIQQTKLDGLLNKIKEPIELSQTSKSMIKSIFLANEYNYKPDIETDAMLKGTIQEDEAIALLCEVTDEVYFKNEQHAKDLFFTGTPDIVTEDAIIDIKCSQNPMTFMNAEMTKLYEAQLQVYMELFDKEEAILAYCLVDAPGYQVAKAQGNIHYNHTTRFMNDEASEADIKHTEDRMHQVVSNMTYSHIPKYERIKLIPVKRDPAMIERLQHQIILARAYYKTLKLN